MRIYRGFIYYDYAEEPKESIIILVLGNGQGNQTT